MAFAFTEKLLSFTWLTVLHLSCSLQLCTQILCVRNYIAILSARIKAEILRGVCSHVNIDDLRLFFELLLWNIDV